MQVLNNSMEQLVAMYTSGVKIEGQFERIIKDLQAVMQNT